MRSIKHAKHAKPALHPTRTTLSTGLTAVLLPLCMASPALADSQASAPATAATSTATIGANPAPSAVSSAPAEAPAAAPAAAPRKAETVLRISGADGAVVPGAHAVGVRLLADGNPVKNGYVRLEKRSGSGWEYAGRLLTNAQGLGVGKLRFTETTRLRAVYQGAVTREAGQSSEITVTVRNAAAPSAGVSAAGNFRARALQVAAQQRGKPYRYGSTGPSSFDCSGLMVYVFKQAGKSLPRTSRAQLAATKRVSKSAMIPGDLVFTKRGSSIGHVGVYAGNGKFWVAPKSGDVVKLQRIYTSQFLVGRVA